MATNECGCGIFVDVDYDFIDEHCHDSGECPRTTGCRDIELVIGHGVVSNVIWRSNRGSAVSNCKPELAFESTDETVWLHEAGVRSLCDRDWAKIDRLDFAQFDGMIGAGNRRNIDTQLELLTQTMQVANWAESSDAEKFVEELIEILMMLSRLSGYFYYQEMHEEHLLEIISYRITKFSHHQSIPLLIAVLERKTHLKKFKLVLQKCEIYIAERGR